jgi:hypothetical protein
MPSKPNKPEISHEQWLLWLDDPVTMALRAWATERINDRRDMWEGGHFKTPDHFESAIRDSAAQGACSVYREIEALEFELVIGASEDVSTARSENGQSDDGPTGPGY